MKNVVGKNNAVSELILSLRGVGERVASAADNIENIISINLDYIQIVMHCKIYVYDVCKSKCLPYIRGWVLFSIFFLFFFFFVRVPNEDDEKDAHLDDSAYYNVHLYAMMMTT